MKTKKLIKFIDAVGEGLDIYDREDAAKHFNIEELSDYICTKEEVRAMQSALSCIRQALKNNEIEDPIAFITTMLSVHSILKITYTSLEAFDTKDADTEGEDTDD